jgi:RNA polymerase sigma-70 factor (ECF subfamily)
MDLRRAFVEALAPAARQGLREADDLDARLGHAWARVDPSFGLEPTAFMAELARCVGDAPGAALERLHVEDLALALACADGKPEALEAFEHAHAADLARRLEAMTGDLDRAEDLLQELRVRLFVPAAAGRGRIAEYTGRGSLRAWLRVTARRHFIDRSRVGHDDRRTDLPSASVLPGLVSVDPEIAAVQLRYREQFQRAFGAALGDVTVRQRNLLRFRFVHGLKLEEIAGIHRVHRVTVSRWLDEVATSLLDATRDALRRELRLSDPEIDSIVRAAQSQFEVSVARLLRR